MKLRVEKITDEAQSCDFSTTVEGLNERLERGAHDFRLVGSIDAQLTHYRAGADLLFDGHVATRAEGTCARCLEAYPLEVEVPFAIVLTPASRLADRSELRPEDLALGTYSGDEIDLTSLVEEQTILGLPMRGLCGEDCRGLCPICGGNRNLAPCDCRPAGGESPLAVLRALKVGTA